MPAEAWRMHAGVYADAEETELRAAESGARAVDEWNRSHDVHSWGRPQFTRALDCTDSRWPRERFAWSALLRDSGNAGCSRRREPEAGPLEVWSEETEVTLVAGVSAAGARSGHPDPEQSEGERSQEAKADSSPLKRFGMTKGMGSGSENRLTVGLKADS